MLKIISDNLEFIVREGTEVYKVLSKFAGETIYLEDSNASVAKDIPKEVSKSTPIEEKEQDSKEEEEPKYFYDYTLAAADVIPSEWLPTSNNLDEEEEDYFPTNPRMMLLMNAARFFGVTDFREINRVKTIHAYVRIVDSTIPGYVVVANASEEVLLVPEIYLKSDG